MHSDALSRGSASFLYGSAFSFPLSAFPHSPPARYLLKLYPLFQHPSLKEPWVSSGAELAATIYHALGVPLNEPQNNSGILRPLTTGKPVMELFG